MPKRPTMIDVTPHAHTKATTVFIINSVVRLLLHMVIGYLVGALFSEHIYADLSRTEWDNLWVYFWIFFWPFGLLWLFTLYAVVAAALVAGGYWLYRTVWLGR